MTNACSGGFAHHQAFDAYAALRYLGQQEFVDPARIAVLGQSMGGIATLYALDRDLAGNISPSASAPRSRFTRAA